MCPKKKCIAQKNRDRSRDFKKRRKKNYIQRNKTHLIEFSFKANDSNY